MQEVLLLDLQFLEEALFLVVHNANTEEYNGSAWAEVNNMTQLPRSLNINLLELEALQTAGLSNAGGYNGTNSNATVTGACFEYDGSILDCMVEI